MPRLEIFPGGVEIEAAATETMLQAMVRHNIYQPHACGGKGRCSTCRLLVLQGLENCSAPQPPEQRLAAKLHFPPAVRLACLTRISGPVTIRRLVIDDEDLEIDSLSGKTGQLATAGTEKGLFILFADIEGFTAFAENLLPFDIVHILNRYFTRLGKVIRQHQGYINSYMGDGLMALFETTEPAQGAQRAIRAGLAMLAEVEKMGPYLQDLCHRSFHIRIGLHYGQVVTGAFGAAGDRKETVIGDAVNVASRIETANKEAGTRFLVSEVVYELVKEKLGVGKRLEVNLPGKSQVHVLYEIVGLA